MMINFSVYENEVVFSTDFALTNDIMQGIRQEYEATTFATTGVFCLRNCGKRAYRLARKLFENGVSKVEFSGNYQISVRPQELLKGPEMVQFAEKVKKFIEEVFNEKIRGEFNE